MDTIRLMHISYNNNPIKNEIVSLLRKYGGKANCYDKNGNDVGDGKGDLNGLVCCLDRKMTWISRNGQKALINNDGMNSGRFDRWTRIGQM